eukprot:5852241-Pleurochrysis_carterae.AAC.2
MWSGSALGRRAYVSHMLRRRAATARFAPQVGQRLALRSLKSHKHRARDRISCRKMLVLLP